MACSQFEYDQIAVVEARITASNASVTAIIVDGTEEYSINTGQTIRKATRIDIEKLRRTINADLILLDTLRTRCGLNPGKTIIPGF